MNHFPKTTAALRRLSRAIADLFKSPSQRYAELVQSDEYAQYLEAFRRHVGKAELARLLDAYELTDDDGIGRPSSPWWRVKDYEEPETGEK